MALKNTWIKILIFLDEETGLGDKEFSLGHKAVQCQNGDLNQVPPFPEPLSFAHPFVFIKCPLCGLFIPWILSSNP